MATFGSVLLRARKIVNHRLLRDIFSALAPSHGKTNGSAVLARELATYGAEVHETATKLARQSLGEDPGYANAALTSFDVADVLMVQPFDPGVLDEFLGNEAHDGDAQRNLLFARLLMLLKYKPEITSFSDTAIVWGLTPGLVIKVCSPNSNANYKMQYVASHVLEMPLPKVLGVTRVNDLQ